MNPLLNTSVLQSLLQSPMGAFQAHPLIQALAQTQLSGQASGQMSGSPVLGGQSSLGGQVSSPVLGGQGLGSASSAGAAPQGSGTSNNQQWQQLISMLLQKLGMSGRDIGLPNLNNSSIYG